MNNFSRICLFSSLTVGLSISALGAQSTMGAYAGVSVGESKFNASASELDSSLSSGGFTTSGSSVDEKDVGWKIFGGYQFNPNLAVEGGYVDLGKLSFKSTVTLPTPGTVSGDIKAKEGVFVDVLGIVPINDMFSLYGKVGAYNIKTEVSANYTAGTSMSDSARNSGYAYGLGGEMKFDDAMSARIEWQRFNKVGDSDKTLQGDIDLFSVAAVFKF